jgi:uncharacterized protein
MFCRARPIRGRTDRHGASMLTSQIDYASLVEQALLRVVRDVLDMVAEHGLPGRHHLYITFRTDHPDVAMDDTLHARYPGEMTIVLQHEFWGLEVVDDRFAVTLSFNGVPQRLAIPFAAVTVFADPSVEFGLQFTRAGAPVAEAAASLPEAAPESATPPEAPASVARLPTAIVEDAEAAAPAEQGDAGGAEVVTLDRFRKK